jgi:hypothetical protein
MLWTFAKAASLRRSRTITTNVSFCTASSWSFHRMRELHFGNGTDCGLSFSKAVQCCILSQLEFFVKASFIHLRLSFHIATESMMVKTLALCCNSQNAVCLMVSFNICMPRPSTVDMVGQTRVEAVARGPRRGVSMQVSYWFPIQTTSTDAPLLSKPTKWTSSPAFTCYRRTKNSFVQLRLGQIPRHRIIITNLLSGGHRAWSMSFFSCLLSHSHSHSRRGRQKGQNKQQQGFAGGHPPNY